MNKYALFYLFWLIPAYMGFLIFQQAMVYKSTIDTYENGESYLAEILDFDIKQIAAQSNGYVVIRFETEDEVIERKLSLSVQMAKELLGSSTIPLRYQKGAFQEIVLFPTYEIQRTTAYYNVTIAIVAFLITLAIAALFHRYANRRMRSDNEDIIIEMVE